jgi:hydrogenase large subunit
MCFKNLPIEFDAQGNATLKPGVANPYSYTETPAPTPIEDDPERMRELFARNGAVRRVDFDPVTRGAGALAACHRVTASGARPVHVDAAG